MDVLNEVFEQEFLRVKEDVNEEVNHAFLQLIDAYSDKKSHKAIKDMVYKIYSQSSSSPWPKEWIVSLVEPYKVESVEELLTYR